MSGQAVSTPSAVPASDLPGQPRRFYELDSLRGIAALTVVFYHLSGLYQPTPSQRLPDRFPLRLLIDGHQAVILFFILSGFVLALPYRRSRRLDYPAFVLRRICRIYLPYVGALLLGILGDALFHGTLHRGLAWAWPDHWVDQTWTGPPNARIILDHLLFIGNYNWLYFNPVLWSLIYEMRISLVFPFVAIALMRASTGWALAIAAVLSLATRPLASLFIPLAPVDITQTSLFGSQTLLTLHYLAFFFLGGLLAKNLDRVTAAYARLGPLAAGSLVGAALVLYDAILVNHWQAAAGSLWGLPERLADWSTGVGALLLIVFCLESPRIKRLLQHRAVHHLGRVSYSLYLVHTTVLYAFLHLDPSPRDSLLVFGAYLLTTALVAELFYRLVEEPAMRLGRFLAPSRRA